MAFSKCRQPDGRDRTWMRLCWQFCCCVHRSSHCMEKSLEFVLLINGLQNWASWRFLEMFIFAFLVRCLVNRGFWVFLFVSSPILLGERGASHIRVWEQTRSYQPPDAFVSGSRRARIWGGVQGRRITLWHQFGKERTIPSCSLSFCFHAALSFILFYPC